MDLLRTTKILASHLARKAIVYVRQSTMMQIIDHSESTVRQYDLVSRAKALGWEPSAIEVIDEDQGRSGASAEKRSGFARLVYAVANGLVGAILALEISRWARASADWQRLLHLCAVAEVVVIDEHSVYDPKDKDDKLLLDLKGTMSEAELHWLSLRLAGARQSKARRGLLHLCPPTGYIWTDKGYGLDPDEAIQQAIRLVLERFAIEPSVGAVLRWAQQTGFQIPTRAWYREGQSEVTWKPLRLSRLRDMLANPVYAGVYVYSRRPVQKVLRDGKVCCVRRMGTDMEQWGIRIENAHPGYISWEDYLKNQEKLRRNLPRGNAFQRGAPREGAALLAGLLICGRCGHRMYSVCYGNKRYDQRMYMCGHPDRATCWSVAGARLDAAVEDLFLQALAPHELELSLAVEQEVDRQAEELAQQWRTRREQAGYEARRAERRYKAVDPDNRVVARTLEREWEERLHELEEVERQFAQAKLERRVMLSEEDREEIRSLAEDLPRVWQAPTTSFADRKAMLRLVIEAVAATPVEEPSRRTRLRVQWKSGVVTEVEVDRARKWNNVKTPEEAVERIREAASSGLNDEQIAEELNRAGIKTKQQGNWKPYSVTWVRRKNGIGRLAPDKPRVKRAPEQYKDGSYSIAAVAGRLKVGMQAVRGWIRKGYLSAQKKRYGTNRFAWFVKLDRRTLARLAALPQRRNQGKGETRSDPTTTKNKPSK